MSSQVTGIAAEGDSSGEFGANEWLVDEMYELYLKDKNLVDKTWWPVLENYHSTVDAAPTDPTPTGVISTVPDAGAGAAPKAPAPQPAAAQPAAPQPAAAPRTAAPAAEGPTGQVGGEAQIPVEV